MAITLFYHKKNKNKKLKCYLSLQYLLKASLNRECACNKGLASLIAISDIIVFVKAIFNPGSCGYIAAKEMLDTLYVSQFKCIV